MRVSYGASGLSVEHGGRALAVNVTVPRWQPRPGWRFGFGARTSSAVDEHVLSGIEIVADALVESQSVSVEVTFNGQQFSHGGGASFVYLPRPHVCAVSPTSGPVGGDTRVSLHGTHFDEGLSYACRFGGAAVVATFVSGSLLVCTSPPHAFGVATLEISVDAFNFTTDGVGFSFYSEPGVATLEPVGGPAVTGGTRVLVRGPSFGAGSDYRCKFGSTVVRAVRANETALACTSPAVAAGS